MMKIAMIVHAYYLKDARVRRYAELLVTEGHSVDVICLREPGELHEEEHTGVCIHRINISRRRGNMLVYALEYILAFVCFVLELNRLFFTDHRFEIIHVHNFPNFLVFAAIIQKTFGAKILLDVHDPMPELFCSKYKMKCDHALIRFLHIEEMLSTKFSDFVVTANHAFRDILIQRGCSAKKIAVVLNAPDDKFQSHPWAASKSEQAGDFNVLYIGTLAERYGMTTLLKAVAAVKKGGTIPGIRLTIIPKIKNEGDYVKEIFDLAGRLGLDGNFCLLDPVPHDKMPAVIAHADVSAYTPLPDVHMDIALSLKIPEVIAVGRPLVTSRLSVLQKYFGEDSMFMCQPGNVEDCAAKIVEVYRNPEEARRRAGRAQEALKKLGWHVQSQVYLDILDKLRNRRI
jgi:glycosyltransferase involved in cell wall biosynthesis